MNYVLSLFFRAVFSRALDIPFQFPPMASPPKFSRISFNKGKNSFHSEFNKCRISLHLIGIFAELKIPIEKTANNKSK